MNPQLMKLIALLRKKLGGGMIVDADLKAYVEQIEALDQADLRNPEEWPWKDQMDGYIKASRLLLGHFPLVTPVATAVVLNEKMRILLERRSDNGKWSIPSGHIEPGESVRVATVRELQEETGLIANPENLHLLDEFSGTQHIYANGDVIYSTKLVYVVRRCGGTLQHNHESLELRRFPLDEIPENVSGSTKKIVQAILDRYDEVSEWE